MAETHPILEAVARALAQELDADGDWNPRLAALEWRRYMPAALAAARVILSAEPSEGMVSASLAGPGAFSDYEDGRSLKWHETRYGIRASNAALLREIEGK